MEAPECLGDREAVAGHAYLHTGQLGDDRQFCQTPDTAERQQEFL